MVQLVNGQKCVFLGATQDQSGDNMNNAHKISIPDCE